MSEPAPTITPDVQAEEPSKHQYDTSEYVSMPPNPIWLAGFNAGVEASADAVEHYDCSGEDVYTSMENIQRKIRALKQPDGAK